MPNLLITMLNSECQPYYATIIHKRKHPKNHTFRYHSLLFSIEIDQLSKTHGNIFFGINRKSFISINQKDYGNGFDVKKWVKKCLANNSCTASIEKIYLSTFPKVLGIGFNPVSFWYCFGRDKQLLAVIAEVNNTFSERKIYFISSTEGPIKNGETFNMQKDFYVSPFIEVDGEYSFRFYKNYEDEIQTARIELRQRKKILITTSISGRKIDIRTVIGLKNFVSVIFLPIFTLFRINIQALLLWLKGIKLVEKE